MDYRGITMDFTLNDIQQMLKDSASKFIQNDYDFERRQHFVKTEMGFNPDNWSLFAELGWLALPFQEAYGGLDGNLVDLIVLQTELGKGLVTEPFLSSVVLGGNVIQRHANEQQKVLLLEPLICGKLKLAFAGVESHCPLDITQICTKAEIVSDGYILTGNKSVVLGASIADKIVVAARTGGDFGSENGLSLFLVDPQQKGVRMRGYVNNDGGRAADIELDNVHVTTTNLLGEENTAFEAIEMVYNDAIVAVAAEAVGLMEKLLNATVEFTKTRSQFDQTISKFQVLQHRMADMFIECEQAKSMLYYGVIAVAKGGDEADRAAALLKIKVGSSGRLVGQTAVQLHGGMGVSDELDVGHFFKRLTMINTLFGSHDEHLDWLVKQ